LFKVLICGSSWNFLALALLVWGLPGCATDARDTLASEYLELEQRQIKEQRTGKARRDDLEGTTESTLSEAPLSEQEQAEAERERQYRMAAHNAAIRSKLEAAALESGAAGSQDNSATDQTATPYPSDWNALKFPHPETGVATCSVVSQPQTVMNGELATTVQLIVTDEKLYLRSDALLDAEAPESGMSVDTGIPQKFERAPNEVTLEISGGYQTALDRLTRGSFLSVSFAYRISNAGNDINYLDFRLDTFSEAHRLMQACLRNDKDQTNL